jgi:type VI secretion system protein ImpH
MSLPLPLASLRDRVRAAASHVDLFALVRVLEDALSEHTPIGGDARADEERVHFTHPPSLAFPAGDVVDVEFSGGARAPEVTVTTTFLGLLGTESPLRPEWSEDVLFEDEPFPLRAFYDVFQHRAVTLLHRASQRFSPLAIGAAGRDGFARGLLGLVGVDAFAAKDSQAAVDPLQALGLSDLLRCDPNYLDVAALENILQRFFPELRPRVSPADPCFVAKAPEDASLLGVQKCVLGETFAYGAGALDVESTLRLTVGPVGRETYDALMPGGARYRSLRAMLDEWLAGRVIVELEVVVRREEAPALRLGEPFGGRLGVDTRYEAKEEFPRTRVLLLADEARAVRSYHGD